jgi:hypothetical protein
VDVVFVGGRYVWQASFFSGMIYDVRIYYRVLKAVDRRQRAEDRGQKTEDRGQKTEDRRQKTEDRRQSAEAVEELGR